MKRAGLTSPGLPPWQALPARHALPLDLPNLNPGVELSVKPLTTACSVLQMAPSGAQTKCGTTCTCTLPGTWEATAGCLPPTRPGVVPAKGVGPPLVWRRRAGQVPRPLEVSTVPGRDSAAPQAPGRLSHDGRSVQNRKGTLHAGRPGRLNSRLLPFSFSPVPDRRRCCSSRCLLNQARARYGIRRLQTFSEGRSQMRTYRSGRSVAGGADSAGEAPWKSGLT